MKLDWLKLWILRSAVVVVILGTLLCLLRVPGVVDSFWDYVYLLVLIAFYGGLTALLMGVWKYFFDGSGVPSYVYRPKSQYILVRYSTAPFRIERGHVQIWVGMVLEAQLRHRKITLREVINYPRSLIVKDCFMGTADDNVFLTEDGHKLILNRGFWGIRISWEEKNNPWKIVEEE